jgi:hypothetical protein
MCLTFASEEQKKKQSQQQSLPPSLDAMEVEVDVDVDMDPAATGVATQDPNHFIARLNSSKPLCPVLMNTLHFPPRLPVQKHALARLQSLRAAGQDSGFVACQHPSSAGLPPLLGPQSLLEDG